MLDDSAICSSALLVSDASVGSVPTTRCNKLLPPLFADALVKTVRAGHCSLLSTTMATREQRTMKSRKIMMVEATTDSDAPVSVASVKSLHSHCHGETTVPLKLLLAPLRTATRGGVEARNSRTAAPGQLAEEVHALEVAHGLHGCLGCRPAGPPVQTLTGQALSHSSVHNLDYCVKLPGHAVIAPSARTKARKAQSIPRC